MDFLLISILIVLLICISFLYLILRAIKDNTSELSETKETLKAEIAYSVGSVFREQEKELRDDKKLVARIEKCIEKDPNLSKLVSNEKKRAKILAIEIAAKNLRISQEDLLHIEKQISSVRRSISNRTAYGVIHRDGQATSSHLDDDRTRLEELLKQKEAIQKSIAEKEAILTKLGNDCDSTS